MKIIAVTGTKGKTTVVRVLSELISQTGENTLRVDTTGAYVNEKLKASAQASKDLFKLYPTVAPGRFLWLMRTFYPKFTAVMETSLGCNNAGLGYRFHNIGIFTNVMKDHLGSLPSLRTKKDVARFKRFIFWRINLDGYAIFNADDKFVLSQTNAIKTHNNVTPIPAGLHFKFFELKKHAADGGEWITREGDYIVIKSAKTTKKLINVNNVGWTFKGQYEPSVYNLMFVLGGLYAYYERKIPAAVLEKLEQTKFDPYGGRLTMLQNQAGVKILADYAHEKYSLRKVGLLAKQLSRGKTVGVVRLAFDRTEDLIEETGKYIAKSFDEFVVYDKVDGFWFKPKVLDPRKRFVQVVGKISKSFAAAIKTRNPNVTRIIREDKAIAHAAKIAKPGDVVVVIVNDNAKRSIGFIKKYFKADFV